MKNFTVRDPIQMIIALVICSCFVFSSCLKNNDNTGNGPKSQVSITNYVVNASITVTLDNATLTTTPLGFGYGISTGSGGYTPLPSGLHNLKFGSAGNAINDNTVSLASGINYSLFVYDTLHSNKVKTLLLMDNLTAVDTIAVARFLQFIPGADSLTLTLVKGTLSYFTKDIYVGHKTEAGAIAFTLAIPPGNYQVILSRNNSIIFQQATFTVTAGKIYSFIAKGVVNGTGDYKESVSVVQQN